MDFDSMLRLSKEFSLVWFFLIFVGVVAWAYWPGHKKRFEDEGNRLLDDDPVHHQSAQSTDETPSSANKSED